MMGGRLPPETAPAPVAGSQTISPVFSRGPNERKITMKELRIHQLSESGHCCGLAIEFTESQRDPIVNRIDWSSSMGDPSAPSFPLTLPEGADPEAITFTGKPFDDIRELFPYWTISLDEYGDVSEEGMESFDCLDENALIFGIRDGKRVSDTCYDEYGYSGVAWSSDAYPDLVIVTLEAWAN